MTISKRAQAFRARFASSAPIPEPVTAPRQKPEGPWLSAAGAAEFYGFSTPKAFRSWAARHHIVVAHMGRSARYAKRDIDAAMTFRSFAVHKPSLTEA